MFILPALRSFSSWPETAMAPKAEPLKSKWYSASESHPGHASVITTLAGFPEHPLFPVHFT